MRHLRSFSRAVSAIALMVALLALLLLPLLEEFSSGPVKPVAPVVSGSQTPPSVAPVTPVEASVIPGRVFLIDAKFGGEDEPFGKFLWLETLVAVVAFCAALASSFLNSRWANFGRVVAAGVALSALGLMPGTLRQTAGLNYTSLRWGYPIALTASLAALVAAMLEASMRRSALAS